MEVSEKLSKIISSFIQNNYEWFLKNDNVKIYYDNGQAELSRILSCVFREKLQNVEFKKVEPEYYRLFQVADLLCTFELIRLKLEIDWLSKSEKLFFGNNKRFKEKLYKTFGKKTFFDEIK